MENTNIEKIKNTLDFKKSGIKSFRFIITILFWFFIIGFIYTITIQIKDTNTQIKNINNSIKQLSSLKIAQLQLEQNKIQRQCDFAGKQSIVKEIQEANKNKTEVSASAKRKYSEVFQNCIYLSGLEMPKAPQKNNSNASIKKPQNNKNLD